MSRAGLALVRLFPCLAAFPLAGALACARPASAPTQAPAAAPSPTLEDPRAAPPHDGPLLLRGVAIVDAERCTVTEDRDVAIADGRIVEVGSRLAPPPGARVIDEPGLVVLPGFVDTHTHLWQHVAKGLAQQSSLQEWVMAVYELAPYLGHDDMRVLVSAGAREALLSGITSVIDFTVDYHGGQLPGIAAGLRESGMGGAFIVYKPGLFLPPEGADQHIGELRALAGKALELRVGFGPLSFFPIATAHDGIVLARRNGLRVTEHVDENLQEQRDMAGSFQRYLDQHGPALARADRELLSTVVEDSATLPVDPRLADVRRYLEHSPGLDPQARKALAPLGANRWPTAVPVLEAIGALDGLYVAIHAVWVSDDDIATFRRHGVIVSHNPESNMVLASGIAPILAYLAAGVRVSLGTDGAASNDRIDMFDAMRTAASLQKVRELDASAPTSCQILEMATVNGAAALARADLGRVAPDHEADLVVVTRERLGLASATDASRLLDGLVFSATPRDVAYVISDGAVRVEHGELVGVDEAALAAAVGATIRAASERARDGARYDRAWLERDGELPTRTWLSVRPRDAVELELPAAAEARRLELAFSGTTFGGNTPFTMAAESLRRFPVDAPEAFARLVLDVPAGAAVVLSRPSGGKQWTIRVGREQRAHEGVGSEQVMLRWAS